jgi:hypothetical protein
MTTPKLYVEIPHQRPAAAYWATDDQMIAFACERESEYIDEKFGDGEITIEQATEAIGHDLSGLYCFDAKDEAVTFFKIGTKHKRHEAIAAIEKLDPHN